MTDLPVYPDLEAAVIELLTDLGTCDVVTPSNLQSVLPFIRVVRSGGSDDRITDTAKVDIDVFAADRTVAIALARTVQQRMLSFPHSLTNCVIDRVDTSLSPSVVPWANNLLDLATATYSVSARRTFSFS